jgi:hypothetical protein
MNNRNLQFIEKYNKLLSGTSIEIKKYTSGPIFVLNSGRLIEGELAKAFKNFLCRKSFVEYAKYLTFNFTIDDLQHLKREARKNSSRSGGINCQKIYGCEQLRNENKIVWNRGVRGYKITKRVLSDEEKERRSLKMRETNNKRTKEQRKNAADKASKTMKNKIRTGDFTPNIHNSLTRNQINYRNITFRSSWEAAYYYLNPDVEYEKLRLDYVNLKGENKVYITDFIDHNKKYLVEVKPKSHINRCLPKIISAKEWCSNNGYTFMLISEDYFINNIEEIIKSDLPDIVKNRIANIRCLK